MDSGYLIDFDCFPQRPRLFDSNVHHDEGAEPQFFSRFSLTISEYEKLHLNQLSSWIGYRGRLRVGITTRFPVVTDHLETVGTADSWRIRVRFRVFGLGGPAMIHNSQQSGDKTEQPQPFAAPAITLPKGGGAIRGIGEKFASQPGHRHRLDVRAHRH